jgi:thiosulfate/3-mercaptopyruvate sulfurtransferase
MRARLDSTGAAPPLVSTEWLAARLDDPSVRIADVRWYLPHLGKSGRAEYERRHIPAAVFVDLDRELAAPPGSGPGRHPLPSARQFESAMSRAGVGRETHVVAYDDTGGSTAARLWWLLRYFGHSRASVLDGGLTKWLAEGRPVTAHVPTPPPATFKASPGQARVVDKAAVQRLSADPAAVLLDARAAERYEGRVEPIDARAGHVPGARSAPYTGNVSAGDEPVFLPPERLRERYAALGVTPDRAVVAYCGSGVNACHTLLALEVAGFPQGVLYQGSWSDWSADPSLIAATGPDSGPR